MDLGVTLSNLARLHQRRGDWRAAAPLLGRLLAIKQRALGETHSHSISLMLAVANARSSLGEYEVAEELVRRALALQERAQAGDADIVRSLSALSKICLASGKTQLGTELADRAAKRQKRIGMQPRARNTRARLDRDTPDFSVGSADMARPHPSVAPPLVSVPTPPRPVAQVPKPATPGRSGTPAKAGTPSKPSTPQAPGLMRAYAQMIESTANPDGARRGKRRSWWARLFSR